MTHNQFYIYALLDPRKPGNFQYGSIQCDYEPFYVGKGHGSRCYDHFMSCNLNDKLKKSNKIKKIIKETGSKPIIIKLFENLYEEQALETEIFLIRQIGRDDMNLGPLTNLTDGGDGTSGYTHNDEAKKKMSKSHTGLRRSEETKLKISINNARPMKGKPAPNLGKHHPQEVIEKIRQSKLGKPCPNEVKEKLRIANLGKKQYEETIQKRINSRKNSKEIRQLISEFFITMAIFQPDKLKEYI